MPITTIVEVLLFPAPLEFKDSVLLTSSNLQTALVVVLFCLIYKTVGRFGISWRQPEEVYLALLRWLRHLLYWPELIHCVLQPQYSLTILPYRALLWIFQHYWLLYWYPKAQKNDQFLKLVTFSLYFLTSEIYWKRNMTSLGLVSAGILLLSLAALWLTQLVIFKYFKSQAVLVATGGESSADSGHMLVEIGGEIMEIFRDGGALSARILIHERTIKPQFQTWQYFCVPTLTYGIMGRCRLSGFELLQLFDQNKGRLQGGDYNSSYQSCQEIALNFAAEITEREDSIAISLTMSKSLLLAISVFVPGLLLVAWSRLNVIVQWRSD